MSFFLDVIEGAFVVGCIVKSAIQIKFDLIEHAVYSHFHTHQVSVSMIHTDTGSHQSIQSLNL